MDRTFGKSKLKSKEEYLKIFKQFDMDNSGGVSKDQIIKVLQAGEIQIDEEEAEDIINQIDADGGGEVEEDEFIAFLQREDVSDDYSEEEMKKLFGFFLQEGKDKIGFEDLKKMLQNLGQKVVESEVLAMLVYADQDKDGFLNFKEFSDIIRSV